MITKELVESEGWNTIMVDNHSFVSELPQLPIWKEMWYDQESFTLQILDCQTIEGGAIIRETVFQGPCEDISEFRQIVSSL